VKYRREYCEVTARRLLEGFKVKHPDLEKRLADFIEKHKRTPDIKVFWNSETHAVDFKVVK
jgi:hypothetical protein